MLRGLVIVLLLGGCDRVLRLDPIRAADAITPDVIYGPPTLTASASAVRGANVANVSFTITIPDGSDRLLIVAVETAMDGGLGHPPVVQAISTGGVPLTLLAAVDSANARCEQWKLVDPPTGVNEIMVMLAGSPSTLHSNAMSFAGVNQGTPVRASNGDTGSGVSSTVMVASANTDLVESTVSQGTGIAGPANGTLAFLDNFGVEDSGDNAAGSTALGSDMGIAMSWTFMGLDTWQELVVSLEPVGS